MNDGLRGVDVSIDASEQPARATDAHRARSGVNYSRLPARARCTSEIKFSVLIDAAQTELPVRTLHTLYGLD